MQKKYGLPIKIIPILFIAFFINTWFNPAKANADVCKCVFYTADEQQNKAECYPYPSNITNPDDPCFDWLLILNKNSSVYTGPNSAHQPFCASYSACGAIPLTDKPNPETAFTVQQIQQPNSPATIINQTNNRELLDALNARKPILGISIPNLTFSDVSVSKDDSGTYVYITWLPELISAIYKFSISIASIVAVIIIIIQGVRIVISGGGPAKATAYKRISQSVVGLGIAWGSFAILYTINPSLVKFNALKVQVIQGIPQAQESDSIPENKYPVYTPTSPTTPTGPTTPPTTGPAPSIQQPKWNAYTFDCSKTYQPAGVIPPEYITTYTCPGLEGNASTIKEMKDPLCKVGSLALAQGYTISIRDSYRDFQRQVSNWCGPGARDYPDVQERKSYYATPGYSNHGHGRAVDVILKKDGRRLFEISSKTQCSADPQYIAKIANLFYAADPNFVRLNTEIWHFEYGTAGQDARSQTTGGSSKCK